MAELLAGVDIGGTTTKMAFFTRSMRELTAWTIPTRIQDHGETIVADICESIHAHISSLADHQDVLVGVGVGVAGNINTKDGTVLKAFNLGWPLSVPLSKQIRSRLHVPVEVENDANVAALGEASFGSARTAKSMVLITLGTGIGAGIIINGEIYSGITGCAGEVGHIVVPGNQFQCSCGNTGCLETVASANGMVRLARRMAKTYPHSSSLVEAFNSRQPISSKEIMRLASVEQDRLAIEVVKKVCEYLGWLVGNLINILNPASIVIGGGMAAGGNYFLQGIQQTIPRYVFAGDDSATMVTLATLGNEAGVIGAGALINSALKKISH
ncbi:ROK family glucokinase [Lacticaseibacillus jixiensis]|uniref:ROK family glucokinase n=1 Tax=Lacticaseibacillus jixiensis TaxID=3231926 RepID=UPI0036F2DDC3